MEILVGANKVNHFDIDCLVSIEILYHVHDLDQNINVFSFFGEIMISKVHCDWTISCVWLIFHDDSEGGTPGEIPTIYDLYVKLESALYSKLPSDSNPVQLE